YQNGSHKKEFFDRGCHFLIHHLTLWQRDPHPGRLGARQTRRRHVGVRDPVWLEGVGWVLDVEDAVANKITAVISRGEIRDYLDALSIRESKRFSDTELYRIAKEHDETFSPELFAESLSMMTRLPDWRFDAYVTRKELKELRKQAEAWMESIRKDGKESQSSKRTSEMQEDRQTSHRGDVFVNGYTKADGTQVAAHWRSRPDRSRI
uniref:hypothetical protein n=1 Tax=uncultured Bifidobacterium sp. TaxID=165187 RepID=UPI0025989984